MGAISYIGSLHWQLKAMEATTKAMEATSIERDKALEATSIERDKKLEALIAATKAEASQSAIENFLKYSHSEEYSSLRNRAKE